MSFLRKLLGDKRPEPPAEGRTESPAPPRPPSAPSPPPVPRPAPVAPTLADLSPRALHAYFEYVGGGSSKFYAVSLEEEEGGSWRVRFNFGRIGSPRAWQTRIDSAPWAKAARAYMALVDERTGKGYEIRAWPASLALPDGTTLDADQAEAGAVHEQVLFRAASRGTPASTCPTAPSTRRVPKAARVARLP